MLYRGLSQLLESSNENINNALKKTIESIYTAFGKTIESFNAAWTSDVGKRAGLGAVVSLPCEEKFQRGFTLVGEGFTHEGSIRPSSWGRTGHVRGRDDSAHVG